MATDLLPLHPSLGNEQSSTQQHDLNSDHFNFPGENPLSGTQWNSYRPEEERDLSSFPFNLDDSPLISGTSSNQVVLPPLDLDNPQSSSSLPTISEFAPDLTLPSSSHTTLSSSQISGVPFPPPLPSSTISDSSSVLYPTHPSQSTPDMPCTEIDFCKMSCYFIV